MAEDILTKLHSLHEQATVERSHFYVGSVAKEAAAEITLLRECIDSSLELFERAKAITTRSPSDTEN